MCTSFTVHIHAAVDAITPSARGELEITDALQWLVSSGADVRASEYDGYWQDTGRVDDVLECNRRLLAGLTGDIVGEADDRSVLIGPVVLEAGARIVRSRIEGPVIIGAGSTVEDCRVGAYTSIGRDCVLRRSGIGDPPPFPREQRRLVLVGRRLRQRRGGGDRRRRHRVPVPLPAGRHGRAGDHGALR
ncbi:hypothetical protein GCM10027075_16710 [Streptomyces heilongjiangensis]